MMVRDCGKHKICTGDGFLNSVTEKTTDFFDLW